MLKLLLGLFNPFVFHYEHTPVFVPVILLFSIDTPVFVHIFLFLLTKYFY